MSLTSPTWISAVTGWIPEQKVLEGIRFTRVPFPLMICILTQLFILYQPVNPFTGFFAGINRNLPYACFYNETVTRSRNENVGIR